MRDKSTWISMTIANKWIDATATLDPATTPVYKGDAPMKFDFLKDMRHGDGFTVLVFTCGKFRVNAEPAKPAIRGLAS